MADRFALAHLSRTPLSLTLETQVDSDVVTLDGYGRFKHGDGAQAALFGRALGALAAERLDVGAEPLWVSSSGFAYVPPAAFSLVDPVVAALRAAGADARPLRVYRAALTNGDYAKMSLEDRERALSQEGLSVTEDLGGALVLALDDVRMTGVHERAVDACLRSAGAREVIHGYVLDAYEAREEPRTEALLNQSGAASTSTLLEIANRPDFVPNARFCKRVLSLSHESMLDALGALPEWVTAWVADAIALDRYGEYPAYRDGVVTFRAALAERAEAGLSAH